MDIYSWLVALILLLGLVWLGLLGLVWAVFRRPLTRTQGEITLEPLGASVEIIRDRWGVPHLYAQNEADLWLAQGFVHAQDRLFQMDYLRRVARGTLAEVFGPAALEADRWSRVLGFTRPLEAELALLSAAERAALERYAAGVNAFIERNRYRLPAEFALAGYKPAAWTPQDSLAVLKALGWALSHNWDGEVLRLQLLAELGPERAAELDPLYPATAPVAVPGFDAPALADMAQRVLAAYQQAAAWLGPLMGSGASNAWVATPARTATRRPLLANDPHLTAGMPTFWYENHLQASDSSLEASGAIIPGLPGVLIGHNAAIGWGITAGRADTQDVYLEQRHAQHPDRFRYGDEWQQAEVHTERITVRGQPDHSETVISTRHGPLINTLLPAEQTQHLPALALRWSGHTPGTGMSALLALPRAQDWPTFRAAVAQITDPSLNLVYADTAGNIGVQYVGRIPRRRGGNGLLPSIGWTAQDEWDGWLSFDALPYSFNPDAGFALTANNKPVGAGYPHFLGDEWMLGYRATRIERLLQAKPRYAVRDFQNMQTDVYSVQAELLQPYLILAEGKTPLEQRIVRELETWNLHVEVDSFPAAAYEVMRIHLLDLLLEGKVGQLVARVKGQSLSSAFPSSAFGAKATAALINLLEQETSWWFNDASGGQPRTREHLLNLALQRTAVTLDDLIGKDPRKWAWGKVHQIEFEHLFGRRRFLRIFFNRGQYPVGGDEQTVWMTAGDLQLPFGLVHTTATYRQVLDVGDWDRSTAVLSTGQSGQPTSPHYADMIDLWREGDQHPMLWTRAAIEVEAEATLWLRPL